MRAVWEVLLAAGDLSSRSGAASASSEKNTSESSAVVVLAGVHEDLLVVLSQRP